MATSTALTVARHVKSGVDVRTAGLRGAPQPFRFYQSPEGHSCVRKAVELLGFGSDAIRTVPSSADYRMDPGALDRAIAEDVAAGIRPIAAIASAGTVNTGAIDPIEEIAAVCALHGVWLHEDAAYGGPAILTDEYAARLAPIARADSVALDPHKWMYVPVEAGFVVVRDADAMRSAFSLVPPYIRTRSSASEVMGLPWFSEYGFQQTRGFRALKVWMTMKKFGRAGHKEALESNIALAGYLAGRVREEPDFELMAPPGLSVVCFRYLPVNSNERDEDTIARLNRALLDRLQLGGEAFLTSTELGGRFVLRACIVNYRSTREDIDRMLTADGEFPNRRATRTLELLLEAVRRHLTAPLPRSGPLQVPFAESIRDRPCIRDHDDDPSACDTERLTQNGVDLRGIEVFEHAATEYHID